MIYLPPTRERASDDSLLRAIFNIFDAGRGGVEPAPTPPMVDSRMRYPTLSDWNMQRIGNLSLNEHYKTFIDFPVSPEVYFENFRKVCSGRIVGTIMMG